MHTQNQSCTHLTRSLLSCAIASIVWTSAQAAPGTIPDAPLFTDVNVEPNIYFVLDDSGSMEWDVLVEGATDGITESGNWPDEYVIPTTNNGQDTLFADVDMGDFGLPALAGLPVHFFTAPTNDVIAGNWRLRNAHFNALYYNPEIDYRPWPGVDADGNALYSDVAATSAPVDPRNPAGDTMNLLEAIEFVSIVDSIGLLITVTGDSVYPAMYYTWTDTDGDGVVDADDEHAKVEIRSDGGPYTGGINRADCAAAPSCTFAEESQNFANWFTYYRKRAYVGLNAIGSLINATNNKRMGLDLYNSGNRRNADSMSSDANRLALLQSLYGSTIQCDDPCPGTPARAALQRVGDLFEGDSSPIVSEADGGACQQNFDIVVSDGFWNGAAPDIGNTDGDNNTDFDGGLFADTYSNTLADVAMHYYERDLKPLLPDGVRTTEGKDEAVHQHLTTFTVGFGVNGTLNPETQTPGDEGFAWPEAIASSATTVDDLWHAAYNGRGEYLSARSPQELNAQLAAALSEISARQGAAAAVSFNSGSLSNDSAVFLAQFNTENWTGDLLAYDLDGETGEIAESASWRASTQLDDRNLSTNDRVIFTHNAGTGVPFLWDTLPTTMKDDLRTDSLGAQGNDAIGKARLDFLRGARTCELSYSFADGESCDYTLGEASYSAKDFRDRGSRMGDVVHSGPVYVGPPELDWPDVSPYPTGTTYSEWKESNKNRSGVVYIGANDGMLHGFREDSGSEVMAYVPSFLASAGAGKGLHYLTEPGYGHKFYVDLTPTVSDVHVSTVADGTAGWNTVLIGGARSGGRGLFALDVTSPTYADDDAANVVMWEFTHPDLGLTFSRPSVALLEIGNNNYDWYAVFGNGYNDTGSGTAKLFLLKLEGGLDGEWTENDDYVIIDTGVGGNETEDQRNGLSTPTLADTDGDGIADRAYAGDLEGNMWAFSLSANDVGIAGSGNNSSPLFAAGPDKPITSKPEVVRNLLAETGGNEPNTIVLFGTGQYLVTDDIGDGATQTFYGVWDRDVFGLSDTDGEGNNTLNPLILSTTSHTDESGDTVSLRTVSVPEGGAETTYVNDAGDIVDYGWRVDLNITRERVVTNPLIRGELVFFNTTIPDSDLCSGGGTGWLLSLDYLTGGAPSDAAFDINGDGVVDEQDLIDGVAPVGSTFEFGMPADPKILGNKRYTAGTGSSGGDSIQVDDIQILLNDRVGRLSWEELVW